MPSDLPQFTVRIQPLLLKKLKYIAEYNARSCNQEVGFLIRRHIREFEREHGKIPADGLKEP